jgi:DnaJ family protein A protein 2
MSLTISLSEALLGMNRVMFQHLDGKGIRIETKRGERIIRHGDELLIKGEGMPIRGSTSRGGLRISFEVEMPGLSWASRTDPEVSRIFLFMRL